MKLTFIIGTGRCGSTLLHEIIAKHKDVSFFSNFEEKHARLEYFGKWASMFYRNNHLSLSRKGKSRFAPSEGYRLISRHVSPIYVQPYRDLTSNDMSPWLKKKFYQYFEENYNKYNKPILLHKYTGWSRIGFFSEVFPQAKFIHIVRDGRAVASSWLQMKWWGGYEGPEKWLWGPLSEEQRELWNRNGQSFATLAGISWKKLMDSYAIGSSLLDNDHYLEVKYEDFLENPQEVMKKILSFSGLEWTADFEKHFSKFQIRKSRARSFETDLSGKQLKELESGIEDMLVKYGYL